MGETDKKPLPPYVPYKTFNTFLSHLRAIGMPSHIDKHAMASMSGGIQSWLKAALRYMELTDAEGVPTARLERLVATDGADRKAAIRELFKSSYSFLNGKLDLANTTPSRLRAAVAETGATGETVEKIIAFMLAMAREADVPLSKLLTTRAPVMRRARTKSQTARQEVGAGTDEDETEDDMDATAAMKTIALPKSGGTLTLSGNINLFALVGAERDLVFALIDTMRKFEESMGGDE